jgi:hypothetical protein
MKGKYITTQILLACLSKPQGSKKDIHALLEETIAERRRILEQWEKSFLGVPRKDIHAMLQETIAERKRILQQWENLFFPEQDNCYIIEDKKAA